MRRRFALAALLLGALVLSLPADARADTVMLKNGKVLHGLITRDSPALVCIDAGGSEYVFSRSELRAVTHDGAASISRGGKKHVPAKSGRGPKVVRVFSRHVDVPTTAAVALESTEARTADEAPAETRAASPHGPVTLYGTSWCGYCRAARKFLRAKGVDFEDRDVEKDPDAAADVAAIRRREHLGSGIPIITIGDAVIQGFDRAALSAALGG